MHGKFSIYSKLELFPKDTRISCKNKISTDFHSSADYFKLETNLSEDVIDRLKHINISNRTYPYLHEIIEPNGKEYDLIKLSPIPRLPYILPKTLPDYAKLVISFAFYQLLQKYSGAKLYHYKCPSCEQIFYC